jgi:hypothetical protein
MWAYRPVPGLLPPEKWVKITHFFFALSKNILLYCIVTQKNNYEKV